MHTNPGATSNFIAESQKALDDALLKNMSPKPPTVNVSLNDRLTGTDSEMSLSQLSFPPMPNLGKKKKKKKKMFKLALNYPKEYENHEDEKIRDM